MHERVAIHPAISSGLLAYTGPIVSVTPGYGWRPNSSVPDAEVVEVYPVTPIADFANALLARGVHEVETLIGIRREDCLQVWVVVDNANRATRNLIHEVEWGVMLRYARDDIQFELLRRRGRPLRSLFTIPPSSIIQRMRGPYAFSDRALPTGRTQ